MTLPVILNKWQVAFTNVPEGPTTEQSPGSLACIELFKNQISFVPREVTGWARAFSLSQGLGSMWNNNTLNVFPNESSK